MERRDLSCFESYTKFDPTVEVTNEDQLFFSAKDTTQACVFVHKIEKAAENPEDMLEVNNTKQFLAMVTWV